MKSVITSYTLGLILACSLASPIAAKQRVLEREVSARDVDSIVLQGGNGAARIVAGDADLIAIRVAISPDKLSDRTPWQGIKKWFLSSAYEDVNDLIDAVRLETNATAGGKLAIGLKPPKRTRDSRVREDWQITVPRRLAVKVAMDRADTEITGVAGGVGLAIGNGAADIDVPGGDLNIDVTVGKANVRTGSEAIAQLSLRSQVGDTNLWMNGMKIEYEDPPGPGSRISMSGKGDDSIDVFVQVGNATLRVNED